MLKKGLHTFHKIFGTILSILFLVWFLSGFVMIYHTFPKVPDKDRYIHAEVIDVHQINYDSLAALALSVKDIQKLQLSSFGENAFFTIKSDDSIYHLRADDFSAIQVNPSYNQIENYASKWSKGNIYDVDTLWQLEQWIPFGRLKNELPIYKFYFGDEVKSELYVSSKTGNALQFTDADSRFWAWLGAIPHWIYFTKLRQDTSLWSDVVIVLSGFGSLMCLVGIIRGISVYRRNYKRKKRFETPFRKFSYKWHHKFGFIFGLFVFTFVFSGMMSLADIPQWVSPSNKSAIKKEVGVALANYKLSLKELSKIYGDSLKSVEWGGFGEKPFYKIIMGSEIYYIDASEQKVEALNLNKTDIQHYFKVVSPDSLTINLMTDCDSYYLSRKRKLPLPVYKVEVKDEYGSVYYVNPQNGSVQYYDTNKKIRKWMYQALHSFSIKFLLDRPILWNLLMWLTMIGGTFVSITGVVLSIKYIKRIVKRKKCSNTEHS